MPFLEIEGLIFNYEDMHMRFDLAVEAGECVGIVGPSGAGKSTLLSLIGGFEKPLAGTIRVGGEDITRLPPAERPVTTLFQDFNLFPHLSVAENVGLGRNPGLKLDAADQEQVAWSLRQVGLDGFEARLPGQLSGGERQRVALARSLIRHRPLLLLDEPFAALGPALRVEMLELTDLLRKAQGLTVLLVTHDPNEAARIATRTAFIAEGEVALFGTTDEVLRSDNAAVREYLGR
ncbi:thiamine ABC transporter ATP-binding protein [Dongia sedimenti]|uniref:Thiamine ABC transporter ATP-binding protein n=1 Tax=Dongia sedimenti TaxID=3064282 RepID=A0ABU0YWU2_9PROT|nr:thiamine ABC transporter ATP-binding protein [Rhodospirillaceae bacterium R-7]